MFGCLQKRKGLSKPEYQIKIGEKKLQNESNIIAMLQTISKLKAAVSIIVGEDK